MYDESIGTGVNEKFKNYIHRSILKIVLTG